MSVDFSNVKAGDRVKLTRENGDETTFKVERVTQGYAPLLEDMHGNAHYPGEWDTFEVLEQPLPTNENAMIGHPTEDKWHPYIYREGSWYNPGYEPVASEERVRWFMQNRGFEVLYNGIPSDA